MLVAAEMVEELAGCAALGDVYDQEIFIELPVPARPAGVRLDARE